jgi:hypothetical protein
VARREEHASGRGHLSWRYVGQRVCQHAYRKVPSPSPFPYRFHSSPSFPTSHDRYQSYVERFRSIFHAPASLPVYYLPGNHDVGLGHGPKTSVHARSRYLDTFGPLSQHIQLGGYTLLMVDAPALVDEDWRRDSAGENRTHGLPKDLIPLQQTRARQGSGKWFLRSHRLFH